MASPLNLHSYGPHVWQRRRLLSTPGLSVLDSNIDGTVVKPDQHLESPFSHTTYFLEQFESRDEAVFLCVHINDIGSPPLLILHKHTSSLPFSCE